MRNPGRMNKVWKKVVPLLLAAVMCVTFLPGAAQAAASYPSNPANPATIPVRQEVSDGTFAYTLTPKTDEGDADAPMPAGTENGKYSFSISGTATRNITIESSRPGTWYYTLEIGQKSGYTYETVRYRIGVQYYYDNGTLKANINALADGADQGRKADHVDFVISPAPTAAVDPAVSKKISGDTPSTDTTFQFILTPANDAAEEYMPEGSSNGSKTLVIDGAKTGNFGQIVFREAGTFAYNVHEVKGTSTGYTYDENTYTITYTVTENGDSLSAASAVTEGNTKVNDGDTVTITNTYKAPEQKDKTGVGDPSITKVIQPTVEDSNGNGIMPTEAKTFHFTLSPYDADDAAAYPMPDGAEDGKLSITTKGQGSAEFGDIHFSETGTYNYKITEQVEDADGYTYDQTIFKIRYEVTEGEDDLVVTRTMYRVENGSDELVENGSDDVTFTNRYEASSDNPESPENPDNPSTPGNSSGTSGKGKTSGTGKGTTATKANGTTGASGVKTGDVANISMYMGMLAGAAALLILLGAWRKRKKEEENG